jgi:VIT1/CCC1 family predicted Fe2+/Mn2+ transporter
VTKAINNYNIANAQITARTVNVSVGNNPTEQSLLDYAQQIVNNNPKEAIQTYKEVLKANPGCYKAWLGIAEANVVLTDKGEFSRDIFSYSAVGGSFVKTVERTVEGTRQAAFGVYIVEEWNYETVVSTIEQYYNDFMNAIENARRCVPANEKNIVEQFFDKNVTMAKQQAEEYLKQKLAKQQVEEYLNQKLAKQQAEEYLKQKQDVKNRISKSGAVVLLVVGLLFILAVFVFPSISVLEMSSFFAVIFILGLVVAGVGLFVCSSFGAFFVGVTICTMPTVIALLFSLTGC